MTDNDRTRPQLKLASSQRPQRSKSPVKHKRPPKKREADGHEKPLASMAARGDDIMLLTTSGRVLFGQVEFFDRFTITVLLDDIEYPSVIFKHSIEEFRLYDEEVDYSLRYNEREQ